MDHQKFDFSELWIIRNMPFRILDHPKNERPSKLPLFAPKIQIKILIPLFLRSPIIYCWNTISSTQTSYKKIGNPQSIAEHPKPTLIGRKIRKNSNFAVFEGANNFIAGIPFLAH